jgi:dTDP-4-dehydrorhamnose 3,5-epimerase
MLEIEETAISAVKALTTKRLGDPRGVFSEVYHRQRFKEAGITTDFVQDNYSVSAKPGTVRGLHFQIQPFAQEKLVRVTKGRILDVAVDLRRSSPTFGTHVSLVLSAENFKQLLIPAGFAHGYCTLEPDTEILYKVSNYYSAEHDRGLAWDDPALAIRWPVTRQEATLSERDLQHPTLAELPAYFA